MGYSYSSISKILDQKPLFEGKRVVTLGTLYPFLEQHEYKRLVKYGVNKDIPEHIFSKHIFVELLGAELCHSLDVSDYQQSEIICNLNYQLPESLFGQYDVVVDLGTLEHLSNLSVALNNIFSLLKQDGLYYFSLPCNNWVNHGFFQFSPTFFIDLCSDNLNYELYDLHLSLTNRAYSYYKMNSFFRHALFSSNKRLVVGGYIKKSSHDLNLNLTQYKYRQTYVKSKETVVMNQNQYGKVKKASIGLISWFSESPIIPLFIKEFILNLLFRIG